MTTDTIMLSTTLIILALMTCAIVIIMDDRYPFWAKRWVAILTGITIALLASQIAYL